MRHTPQHAWSYTPYGYNANRDSKVGFNGEFQDPVTGLHPLGNGHRMYNPTLMRFCSRDDLSPFSKGGLNSYTYCLGDPVNLSDPTGRAGVFSRIKKTLTSTWDLAGKSMFPRRSQPDPELMGGRSVINDYARKLSSSTPFIEKLDTVNHNLASHGDVSLTSEHAQIYVDIAERTRSGSISNTTAHLQASREWMKADGAPQIAGSGLNLLAALGAGAEDHALLKTGRSLAYTQQRIRTETSNTQTKKSPPV